MIDEGILISYGAEYKKYDIGEILFSEGDSSSFYFQVVTGLIKLNNYNENGKEFTHWIVNDGKSVLETVIFIDKPYPVNAIAIEETLVLRLQKTQFFHLLKENLDIYHILYKNISAQMQYKYIMLEAICLQNPENKLKTFMNYLKDQHSDNSTLTLQIPFTRKQLASLTGLSVETVIRVIKKMEKNKMLTIKNRKIFY